MHDRSGAPPASLTRSSRRPLNEAARNPISGGPVVGEVIAFQASGQRAWKKRWKANVYGPRLSQDEQRPLVSTCTSDQGPASDDHVLQIAHDLDALPGGDA